MLLKFDDIIYCLYVDVCVCVMFLCVVCVCFVLLCVL